MKNIITAILLSFFCTLPLFAQLTGMVDGSGLWNFSNGHKEDVTFKIAYDTAKYHIGFNLAGGHHYVPTQEYSITADAKKQDSYYGKRETKNLFDRNWNVKTGFDLGFDIHPQDKLNISLQYQYSGSKDHPDLMTVRYEQSGDSVNGRQADTTSMQSHMLTPNLEYVHTFSKQDNKITLTGFSLINIKYEDMLRSTTGKFYSKDKRYATANSINDADSKITLHYDDKSLAKVENLVLGTGLDFIWHTDMDIYTGRNYVGGNWRDSTNLDRSFLYNSFAIEPFINISYKYKGLEVYVNERIQWYYHELMDQLTERKSEEYQFRKSQFQNILAGGIGYRFNPRHALSLDYKRTLSRPEYDKLSPSVTLGKSDGEYFIGNPDLRPQTTDDAGFTYAFTAEHFGVDFTVGYRYTKDKVEKVIADNVPDDKKLGEGIYFTYINATRQHTGGATLDLKVDYEAVKAKMWVSTFYDTFIKNGKVDKTDFNCEVGISLDAALTPTLHLNSDLTYRSAKQSAYNLKGEYIGANIKLVKTFINTLDLYIQVNDLVDKPDIEQTWNESYTYYKETDKYLNRRSILIGLTYKF